MKCTVYQVKIDAVKFATKNNTLIEGQHLSGGVGIAHFNMATRGVAGGKATVNSVRIGLLFENKVHLKLFIEGYKDAPRQISS